MDWRSKTVLITGGAGFIGSHIADLLAARGAQIIALDNLVRGRVGNLSRARQLGELRFVQGDIRDRDLLADLMAGVDFVFHQAALRITHCAAEPREALEVMFDGAFNVIEAAARAGAQKVVAASSASVYGLAQEFPTAESHHPYDNRTLYGAGKLALEGMLRSFNDTRGLRYAALRYFNVYGPRMDIHGAYTEVLVRWMDRIEAGLPPIIFGDGSQTMDFVFVEDVARANVLAAEADVTDEAFNIGRGEEVSLKQLAQALLRAMNADLPIQYQPERKVNPVPRRLADVRRAREALGFEAQVSLEEGLGRLLRWRAEIK
ncbi:MAG: SDR family NAD(P)-dependent oxidoreductase [Chloroflexi bacterium]|nr:SDR family NAD(P)-dependent oxidoreductase [Chloroflexota bacterium]MBI5291770.1 SDR family NAD(P)-dependent oxidoreductase [Chloroflexota bacterium]